MRRAFDAKVRRGMFKPVARHLPEEVREDRLQEAVAMTFEMFEHYARRGVVLEDAILVHSCRQRATDPSRRFVKTGNQPKRDVFDPRNFLGGRVEVLHLDSVIGEDGENGGEDDAIAFGVTHGLASDPASWLDAALDLAAWLASLAAEDRKLLALRSAGYTLEETAHKLAWNSTSRVFARCRRLGRELAQRAQATAA